MRDVAELEDQPVVVVGSSQSPVEMSVCFQSRMKSMEEDEDGGADRTAVSYLEYRVGISGA